jgi:CubicO group peptidase (beta-lactamase class C family)
VAANRPIVGEDLLKLTCGFGLVLARGPLLDAIKRDSLMPGPFSPPFSADEFMRRLGALPLAAQPGEGWLYHTGFDALAVLLARATGQPCAELLAERITGPLRMRATGFCTDAGRLPTAYRPTADGLVVLDPPDGRFARRPRFEGFGSGLVSAAPDLLAFLEMLLDRGGDVLTPEAVALMSTDRLDDRQRAATTFLGPGRSWGLGGEVVLQPGDTAVAPGGFGWMGGTGATAYIDPRRRLAAVLLTQRMMETSRPPAFMQRFWEAVYQGV